MANYDLIFGILFYVLVIFFFYIMRKNVTIKGILFIYRTKAGLKAMDKIANIFPRLLKGMEPVSIIIGFISMAALFIFLIYYTFLHYKREELTIKEYSFWIFLWALFILVAAYPAILNPIVSSLKVLRKMDFLTILGFMFLTGSMFYIYTIVRNSQKRLEEIVRNMAIKKAKK